MTGKADVLVAGVRCPVVGAITMDMCMVDVTALTGAGARLGDEVVLLGAQGGGCISADELAAWSGTIRGDLLRHLQARAARLRRGALVMADTPGGLMSGPDAASDGDGPRSTWDKIISVNDKIWAIPTGVVEDIGTHVMLFATSVRWLFKRPFRVGVLFEAMDYIGVQSLMIVSMIGLFVGMVFALQLTSALRQFGTEGFVGATLGIAVTRELSPVFTSIVVAARAGAGMATEIGSMRITEQIDALSTIAVNPVQYLVTPRVIAGTIMVPLLSLLFVTMAMAGGYGVAVWIEHVDPGVFVENARWIVETKDLVQGIVKATVFGCALTVISCTQGFNASGGAKGVGMGTTRAVVGSFVTILILDYFLTDVILLLQHK